MITLIMANNIIRVFLIQCSEGLSIERSTTSKGHMNIEKCAKKKRITSILNGGNPRMSPGNNSVRIPDITPKTIM